MIPRRHELPDLAEDPNRSAIGMIGWLMLESGMSMFSMTQLVFVDRLYADLSISFIVNGRWCFQVARELTSGLRGLAPFPPIEASVYPTLVALPRRHFFTLDERLSPIDEIE